MSRLLVLTRTALVAGFQLAGVDAYGAEEVESAEELIAGWLDAGETGLLAIDEGILEQMSPAAVQRLQSYEPMPHLAIPGCGTLGPLISRKARIAETIRKAIGIHITFKGEEAENA